MRKPNPSCGSCRHAFSFHARGVSGCHVMGCHCPKYKGRNPDLPSWLSKSLSAAEMARAIKRSEHYVLDHAEDLGGVRIHPHFLGRSGAAKVWRFNPKMVDKVLAAA